MAETVDHGAISVPDAVGALHPDGIDLLIDLANDRDGFADLAVLVRRGGIALTTTHVADPEALAQAGITGVNCVYKASPELLERLAGPSSPGGSSRADTDVHLDEVPAALERNGHTDGKTVITVP